MNSYLVSQQIDQINHQDSLNRLEEGAVLFFPEYYFSMDDLSLMSEKILDGTRKNISYDPLRKAVSAYAKDSSGLDMKLTQMMQAYADFAYQLIQRALPSYAAHVQWGRTSFRPAQINGRASSKRKDDTRLHVDSFSASPVQGLRILRVFCNINANNEPRVWNLGEPFPQVLERFAPQIAPYSSLKARILKWFKITKTLRSAYDHYMFRSIVIDVSLTPFIIHHPLIAGVTFTGSNRIGKSVAGEAGTALKKIVLELGGSDPYIILDDADIELAAEQCVLSRLNNAGQVCIAAKRIIVVESIRDDFEALVLEKTKKYTMGNPMDPKTILGPLAREDLRLIIEKQVKASIEKNARCLLGATRPEIKGYYYPATVLTHVDINSPAFCEELFGPVICIISAKNENSAISLANNTLFGLGGAIFTQDLEKGERFAKDFIKAGSCAVNVLVASDPRLPFGGIKQSGYGRELSIEGMREFANIKTIIVNSPQ